MIELEGAAKAASELHAILRERFPSTNIFVDASAGPVGPCKVAMDDIGFSCAITMTAHWYRLIFTNAGHLEYDSFFTDSHRLLEQIDQLVLGALQ